MRHAVAPRESRGFAPLWISLPFLDRGEVIDRRLVVGEQVFEALLVDVEWLELRSLERIARLVESGLVVILARRPRQPGVRKSPDFARILDDIEGRPSVARSLQATGLRPIVEGEAIPPFWARTTEDRLILFFAHPDVEAIRYPLPYPSRLGGREARRRIVIQAFGESSAIELIFSPYQAVVIVKDLGALARLVDAAFHPPTPPMVGEDDINS